MFRKGLTTGLVICMLGQILPLYSPAIERVAAAGAREAALSQAVVALSGNFSVFNNQALLAGNISPDFGISFRQPYLISGYTESAISFVIPVSSTVFAMGVTQSAIATYRETDIGIAIAKGLSRRLSAGLLFNYFFLNFPEIGRCKGSFIVDGGISFNCSDHLVLGVHLKNFISTKVETFQYSLLFPFVFRGGASCHLGDKILLTGETVYEKCFGTGFRFGTECLFGENFRLRGGISTNPFQHSFGFGYQLHACGLDFAMVHHELLGYSPVISFSFNFKK